MAGDGGKNSYHIWFAATGRQEKRVKCESTFNVQGNGEKVDAIECLESVLFSSEIADFHKTKYITSILIRLINTTSSVHTFSMVNVRESESVTNIHIT